MVFTISGTKGSGQVEFADGDQSQSCVLVMADGRRFDVVFEEEWSEDDFSDGTATDGAADEEAMNEAVDAAVDAAGAAWCTCRWRCHNATSGTRACG